MKTTLTYEFGDDDEDLFRTIVDAYAYKDIVQGLHDGLRSMRKYEEHDASFMEAVDRMWDLFHQLKQECLAGE